MTSYHNLAICMRNQGKVPEAEHWHRNALGSRKEGLGKRHPISKGRMLENTSQVLARLFDMFIMQHLDPQYRKSVSPHHRFNDVFAKSRNGAVQERAPLQLRAEYNLKES